VIVRVSIDGGGFVLEVWQNGQNPQDSLKLVQTSLLQIPWKEV
jgi:hypothetical protein